MASKRNLKKYMKFMAENVAGETAFILNYYDNIDAEKAFKVIDDLIALLDEKLKEVSISFDKTRVLSFEKNTKEYRKARRTYFKLAYQKLGKEFSVGLQNALKEMNALLSKEQREENKKIANEE